MLDSIVGALSSVGETVGGFVDDVASIPGKITKKKRKKAQDAAAKKGLLATASGAEVDPFGYSDEEIAAIKSGDKDTMKASGMSDAESSHLAGKPAFDWQGAMGDAMRGIVKNRKEDRDRTAAMVGKAGAFAGNHKFDAGSYQGALMANPFTQFKGL